MHSPLIRFSPHAECRMRFHRVTLLPPEIGIYVWGAWDVFEEIGPGRRRRYRHPLLINVPEDDVDHLIEAWLYHMDLLTTFDDVCRRLAERRWSFGEILRIRCRGTHGTGDSHAVP
jgi:hypothetical protein